MKSPGLSLAKLSGSQGQETGQVSRGVTKRRGGCGRQEGQRAASPVISFRSCDLQDHEDSCKQTIKTKASRGANPKRDPPDEPKGVTREGRARKSTAGVTSDRLLGPHPRSQGKGRNTNSVTLLLKVHPGVRVNTVQLLMWALHSEQ